MFTIYQINAAEKFFNKFKSNRPNTNSLIAPLRVNNDKKQKKKSDLVNQNINPFYASKANLKKKKV